MVPYEQMVAIFEKMKEKIDGVLQRNIMRTCSGCSFGLLLNVDVLSASLMFLWE